MLEISPEVVDASQFFDAENHRALADPRTRLVVGDGRTHLMLGDETYDVIVSEPSNPWMAGIASLFTREFFEGARARLAPGGVLCQWAHTYDISNADLRSIVATFLSVFPDGTLWLVGDADVLLVGSTEPLDRPHRAASRPRCSARASPTIWRRSASRAPFSVLVAVRRAGRSARRRGPPARRCRPTTGRRWSSPVRAASSARRATTMPRSLRAAGRGEPEAAGDRRRSPPRHRGRLARSRADAARSRTRPSRPTTIFGGPSSSNPTTPRRSDGLLRAAASLERSDDCGRPADKRSRPIRRTTRRKLALSRLLASQGNIDGSARIPLDMLQAESRRPDRARTTGVDPVRRRRCRPPRAGRRSGCAGSARRTRWSHYYAASLFFIQGRLEIAAPGGAKRRAARPAQRQGPEPARGLPGIHGPTRRGARRLRRLAQGRSAASPALIRTSPRSRLQAGNRDARRRYFAEALTIDPTNEIARQARDRARAR